MITISDILQSVERMRPNATEQDLKIRYLNEVESEVVEILACYRLERLNDDGTGETLSNIGAGASLGDNPLELAPPFKRREIAQFHPYAEADLSAVPLLPERFSGVYTYYVMAKIDQLEDETDNYQNDALMYQAEKEALIAFLIRNYRRREARTRGLF